MKLMPISIDLRKMTNDIRAIMFTSRKIDFLERYNAIDCQLSSSLSIHSFIHKSDLNERLLYVQLYEQVAKISNKNTNLIKC